ncbi:hypothetical protein pb186bvf_005447 [Paramecium bursaria]
MDNFSLLIVIVNIYRKRKIMKKQIFIFKEINQIYFLLINFLTKYIMDQQLKKFIDPLLKTSIVENLQLGTKPNKLNKQSGLICFLQGYCLETGFQVIPNVDEAEKIYKYGLGIYIDPLCAWRLEQLQLRSKKKYYLNTLRFIQGVMFPLIYDLEIKIKITQEKPKIHEYIMIVTKQIIYYIHGIQYYRQQSFKKDQIKRIMMTQLWHSRSSMTNKPHIIYFQGAGKIFDMISRIDTFQFLDQCFHNLMIHGQNDSPHFNLICSLVLEHSYISHGVNYQNILMLLYERASNNLQRRVLIVRECAKMKKSLQTQLEELNYQQQINTPISYYLCGKYQGQVDEKDCYFCKYLKETNVTQEEKFKHFVYTFYRIKIITKHKIHTFNDPLTIQNQIKQLQQFYDNNEELFDQVRTLQFSNLRNKLNQMFKKIQILVEVQVKNQQEEEVRRQQEEQKRSQEESMKKKQEQEHLQNVRSQFQQQQRLEQSSQKQYVTNSPNMQQSNVIKVHRNSMRSLNGPQIGSKMIDSMIKSDLMHPNRFNTIQKGFQQLKFLQIDQVYDQIFMRKQNRDGEIYQIRYYDKEYFMKSISFLSEGQIKYFLERQCFFQTLDHLNLRKILYYSISDLQQENLTGSLSLVMERYEYNLKQYLQKYKLTTADKWKIAMQICDAVYYLHQQGEEFCNVHPNNILFDLNVPVLSDYDLDYDKDALHKHYMIQDLFNEDTFTQRIIDYADVWSLGCVFLYLFFGVEFTFEIQLSNQIVSLEQFQKLNPWMSRNVDFDVLKTDSYH